MDKLVSKIRDLENDVIELSKVQEQQQPSLSLEHWLQSLRKKGGEWTAGPIVVLSLFDGIGGIWAALSLLGIPFTGYSSELKVAANQVVKERYPMVHHVGDVTKLEIDSIPEKVDLVVGGFPCQDLSSMGHKLGLHGRRSRLFFEMLRVIQIFKPTWFLAENVASMSWQDRDEISKHLRTIPIEIDSQELTPGKRRRIYWSNIPYPRKLPDLINHESTALQSVLKNATALESKVGCILSQNSPRSFASLDLVMDNSTCALRYVTITEVENIMGYPKGYTNVNFAGGCKTEHVTSSLENGDEEERVGQRSGSDGQRCGSGRILRNRSPQTKTAPNIQRVQPRPVDSNKTTRWSLLGNTFSVNVIAYLLSPLLDRAGRTRRPILLPKSVKEEDCSAMDAGEVWAMFNDHERPNWYALIVSRSGDRFSSTPELKKESPIHIEVKFLEMTDIYAAREADEWDSVRGTGLFHVRDVIDSQRSWVAFSHRMNNFLKFDDQYFIYPAKDEVWAVYEAVARSRYLVYVMESNVNVNKARQGKPGKESFHARCRLMRRVDVELYRLLDKEIDYTELAVFAFRAPYIFKSEGSLLKIDLSSRQRFSKRDYAIHQKKRKKDESESEKEDDDEDEDVDVDVENELAHIMGDGGSAGLDDAQETSSPATTPSFAT